MCHRCLEQKSYRETEADQEWVPKKERAQDLCVFSPTPPLTPSLQSGLWNAKALGSPAVKKSVKSPSQQETFNNVVYMLLIHCDPASTLSRAFFLGLFIRVQAGVKLAIHQPWQECCDDDNVCNSSCILLTIHIVCILGGGG